MSAKSARKAQRPDQPIAPSVAKRSPARTNRSAKADGPDIISTVDKRMPVTTQEIDVIEQYLGEALDEILSHWQKHSAQQRPH